MYVALPEMFHYCTCLSTIAFAFITPRYSMYSGLESLDVTPTALLIDNYDSYTYNLYQLMAKIYQREPIVILNDAATISEIRNIMKHETISSIVISPGPGTPDNPGDIGICGDIFREFPDTPILGVCLGCQILGSVYGAVVNRVDPMHGRLSGISHNGHELFKGIPTIAAEFQVVRYHSLAVDPNTIPRCLKPIAWTKGKSHALRCAQNEGSDPPILMGLAHERYPHYGVQFHPESIGTRYGDALLRNFHRLTMKYIRTDFIQPPKDLDSSMDSLSGGCKNQWDFRVIWKKLDGLFSKIDVDILFDFLFGDAEFQDTFWLDSASKERCRFSFMGGRGGKLWKRLTYRLGPSHSEDEMEVIDSEDKKVTWRGSIWDYLQHELKHYQTPPATLPFEFCGGYVGYLGYELKALNGGSRAFRSNTPDASLFFVDRFVAIDHLTDDIYCVALIDSKDEPIGEEWIEKRAKDIEQLSMSAPAEITKKTTGIKKRFELNRGRTQYLEDVGQCMEALYAGESYEICLTNAFRGKNPGVDERVVYSALRRRNPAPYASWLKFGSGHKALVVCCSSPERFLKGDRHRELEAKPIKGTAPRSTDPTIDLQLATELRNSEKNQAENLMIVDLLRNDLGRVCEPSSVHVPKLMEIESYATVHQMVTTVRGRLKTSLSHIDAIKAAFPGGSMTGAPKIRSMHIIDTIEGAPRGVYSGSIGYLSVTDAFDLNIVIRTAVITANDITIGCGGAIVLQSDPVEEYDEICLKAKALLEVCENSQ